MGILLQQVDQALQEEPSAGALLRLLRIVDPKFDDDDVYVRMELCNYQ